MSDGNIWEPIGWVLQIFSNVGSTWVASGQGALPPGAGADTFFYFQEQTPLVVTILREVKTGWSMSTVLEVWGPLLQIPILVTLVFGSSILYCAIRVFQIRQMERAAFKAAAHSTHEQADAPRMQLRWRHVLEQASSDDSQAWRAAILEADHMLNELLDTLGYKGETMGDKLRKADVSAFATIDFAWEAHQVRNRIAQDTSFSLDARETRRVVKMYERVFEEFHFIGGGHDEQHH